MLGTDQLTAQVSKYRRALTKLLREADRSHEPMEIVVIVGRNLSDWTDEGEREVSKNALASYGARVVTYQQLIGDAYDQYLEFLKKSEEAGRVLRLIQEIEDEGEFVEAMIGPRSRYQRRTALKAPWCLRTLTSRVP